MESPSRSAKTVELRLSDAGDVILAASTSITACGYELPQEV